MHILAIDTSDSRGSVCLLRETDILASILHDTNSDYSEWLLPAVEKALQTADLPLARVNLLAVSTGPGSFTGLRVGLTTVKAWAEVYAKRLIGVSRLEAIAHPQLAPDGFVAACYDAQRGQMFGALYRANGGQFLRVGDELVIAPDEFLNWVERHVGRERVAWTSVDPELLMALPGWQDRIDCGDTMIRCSVDIAPLIGRLAAERAQTGRFTDPLELDANYVRRSDAEIFWKGR